MDYDDEDEVAALELVSKKPARSQSLRLVRNPVKISTAAFTKPQFSSYTYDANKAYDVLDDFFKQKLIKHDFGQLQTLEQLKGKKYYKFHNMWNHNTANCVKLKDQIQVLINERVVTLDEEKTVSLVNENPFPTIAMIDVAHTVAMVDVAPTPKHKAKSKYEFYTCNADLAHVTLDKLIKANLLNIPWGHTRLKNNWQLKDQVQQWLNEGRLVIEEGDTKRSPEVSFHVAMVDVVWRKKSDWKIVEESDEGDKTEETSGKGKQEAIPEASKVVLCSRCKVECGILVSYAEFKTTIKAFAAGSLSAYQPFWAFEAVRGRIQQVKEPILEAKNDNTMDTSLVTAMAQTLAEIDATPVVEVAENEPKLVMDEDVSTDEEVGPSPAMMEHLRPLYITANINGLKVSKILIDAGATVSIMTVRTMTMLRIKKSSVIETAVTVKNFAGGVTKTLEILMVRLKVGPSNIVQGFFVTDCTTLYSYILGRDWIHRAACVPSSMYQELLIWDQASGRAKLVKADPKPFSVSTNEIGADYYSSDLRLLTVVDINQSGKPIGVTSTKLAQWGLSQVKFDTSRPNLMVLSPTSDQC
ncbi:hypothetical protein ACLB2K_067336 [Fragaria x ananassa]